MTPLPEDICYKARPAENYDGNARLVVRVADYRTAYNKIVHLESQLKQAVELLRGYTPLTDRDEDKVIKWHKDRNSFLAVYDNRSS